MYCESWLTRIDLLITNLNFVNRFSAWLHFSRRWDRLILGNYLLWLWSLCQETFNVFFTNLHIFTVLFLYYLHFLNFRGLVNSWKIFENSLKFAWIRFFRFFFKIFTWIYSNTWKIIYINDRGVFILYVISCESFIDCLGHLFIFCFGRL